MVQAMINDHADLIEVETDWKLLLRAFENNSPEVHSYLNLRSGDVIRHVDGSTDADVRERIANDDGYLELEAVGSRTQFDWMERFASDVDDEDVREDLLDALEGGKGAFRRFKEALSNLPADDSWDRKHREYRDERLREVITEWLGLRGFVAVERAPLKMAVLPSRADHPAQQGTRRAELTERVSDLTASLSIPKLEMLRTFAEFVSNQN